MPAGTVVAVAVPAGAVDIVAVAPWSPSYCKRNVDKIHFTVYVEGFIKNFNTGAKKTQLF